MQSSIQLYCYLLYELPHKFAQTLYLQIQKTECNERKKQKTRQKNIVDQNCSQNEKQQMKSPSFNNFALSLIVIEAMQTIKYSERE